MTKPRKELVSLDDTPYYHIVSRCVRRTYLCGFYRETQTDYEHRKQWIVDRIQLLSSLFSIDLCSYAVMSNHYHLVIHINPEKSQTLSNLEVAQRWTTLFQGPILVQQWLNGTPLNQAQQDTVNDIITIWRSRLSSLSWYMKCLNEPIARKANKEDNCTGHFWESRYKSQALKTEQALLSCMAYVDLNPVRAKIADTPENSDYTSIQERTKPKWNLEQAIKRQISQKTLSSITDKEIASITPATLMPFKHNNSEGLPFNLIDYLELVDWTGRIIREDKRGHIKHSALPILERLSVDQQECLITSSQFEKVFNQRFNRQKKTINSG